MYILVNYGILAYSVVHIPVVITNFVFVLLPYATTFAWGNNFLTYGTLQMLLSGVLGILLLMIPYISQLAVNKILDNPNWLSTLYYHGVLFGTLLFNTGAAGTFFWFSDALI